MYDPELKTWQEGLPLDINKTLKRRYFLVEKAKNASVIGTAFPYSPQLCLLQHVRVSRHVHALCMQSDCHLRAVTNSCLTVHHAK